MPRKKFTDFARVVVNLNRDAFMQWDKPSDDARLDELCQKFLYQKRYVNIAEVLKKILTFPHSQASIKRGFSVSKTLLVDNSFVISLVSQRVIHDHMIANNLPHTLEITGPLRRHIRSSRQRQQHLDDQTKKNVSDEKQLKRKALNEQMTQLRKRRGDQLALLKNSIVMLIYIFLRLMVDLYIFNDNLFSKDCKRERAGSHKL